MTGSVIGQVTALFRLSVIGQIGKSRHRYKAEARAAGARTSAEIAALCPVTGCMTLDTCPGGGRQPRKIHKGEMGPAVGHRGDNRRSRGGFPGALHRPGSGLEDVADVRVGPLQALEVALTMYAARTASGRTYDFHGAIERAPSRGRSRVGPRHGNEGIREKPWRLIAGVADPCFNIAARLQREAAQG